MSFSFEIDERKYRQDVILVKGGLRAARKTIGVAGSGEVFTGRRPRDDFDETAGRAPWPSWKITRHLRTKGKEPFAVTTKAGAAAFAVMDTEIKSAVTRAYETGTAQVHGAKNGIIHAAQSLRDGVKENVRSGGLGNNTSQYKNRKVWYQRQGRVGSKYGSPPPYGVLTGRWLESIEARWRPGK